MSSGYKVASPFLIRLAGVPFDILEQLSTANASVAAREVLEHESELRRHKSAAQEFVGRRDNGFTSDQLNAWRSAIRRSTVPEQNVPEQLREYAAAAAATQQARSHLDRELESGLTKARRALFEASSQFLPQYLVFGSGEVHHLTGGPSAADALPPRNSRARERERHLLLYLQRIVAKNDTFSEFGPSSWGRVAQSQRALNFEPVSGITRREAFLERWTAHALAAAINTDADAFAEFCPRFNPNGILLGHNFVFVDSGETISLTQSEIELLARCTEKTPGHALASPLELVRELVAKKVLIAAIEVPALEPFAFDVLRNDIIVWRDGPARQRWLPLAASLTELARKFSATTEPVQRQEILSAARDRLAALGAKREPGRRALYAAVNPIAEECYRDCKFEISEALLNEVVTDAEPWIDFWRDTYAFVAGRVAANLRALVEKAPTKNGAIPLPAFLRFCQAAKVPLTGPGLVGMAHIAFQEVKAAFRERLRPHAESVEYELTPDDCAVVRRNFEYAKFDEFTYASADLQLAAESVAAVNRGDYRWIIGELHPAAATLHHCMYWSCPDQAALSDALRSVIQGAPLFHFGFFAADFTAHTTIRIFDALPQHSNFVSPQRYNPRWRYVPPSLAEVFVDEKSGDVAVRAKGEPLGSFARNWIIPLGFHPFQFGLAPHTPRLRCGRVIVQRRAWTVTTAELGAGDFTGLSRDLVIAIERLRATKDWPRFLYIRPTGQALRRSGAEGRDKDTKPVFIDLESYLFLEIFHRWLTKAGELEVTEMLPAPNDLCWREEDGRRTFELRTLIVPR